MGKVHYTNLPKVCDICTRPFENFMFDARLWRYRGTWGNVCEKCAKVEGVELGPGKGQKYDVNNNFEKVEG